MNDLALWRHYLLTMPLYTKVSRYTQPDIIARMQEPHLATGAAYLRKQLGSRFCSMSDNEIARRASWVRLWRESDTYTSLGWAGGIDPSDVRIEGKEHLLQALAENKTVFMLTAHVGSFYFACQSLAAIGFNVFPIARSVDTSPATPQATQWYLNLNYRQSERKFNQGHYLFTDFDGKFDRRIVEAARVPNSLILNLIDMPSSLYSGKRTTVNFLNKPTELPINFVQWALRRDSIIMNYVTGYDTDFSHPAQRPKRFLQISQPSNAGTPKGILQEYATMLESHIAEMPWNWMGLQIAEQYHTA